MNDLLIRKVRRQDPEAVTVALLEAARAIEEALTQMLDEAAA